MPQYKAPGVYVEEVERGPKPIEGVGTSTAGFLGETERGPETPRLLTSYADYQRHFGGVVEDRYLAQAVNGFFQNGGSSCYVGRVTAAEAHGSANLSPHSPSAGTLGVSESRQDFSPLDGSPLDFGRIEQGTERRRTVVARNLGERTDPSITITDVDVPGSGDFEAVTSVPGDELALEPGESWPITVKFVAPASPGDVTASLEISLDGGPAKQVDLEGESIDPSTDDVVGTSTGRLDFGSFADGNTRTKTLTLTNLGSASLDLSTPSSPPDIGDFTLEEDIDGMSLDAGASREVEITSAPENVGGQSETVTVDYDDGAGTTGSVEVVLEADVTESVIEVETVGPGEWGERVAVTVADGSLFDPDENELFQVTVRYWSDAAARREAAAVYADPGADDDDAPDPDVEEVYDNLSTEEASSDYYGKQLDGNSALIGVTGEASGRPANGTVWLGVEPENEDGPPEIESEHFEGDPQAEPEDRTGFEAFKGIDEIAIVCVPDENEYDGFSLAETIVTHCTDQKDRFAILQSEQQADRPGSLEPSYRSDFAAFYYPWLTVGHPETDRDQQVPPGGHVAGIYARSDQEHGVHKAPANEQVRGIRGLQKEVSKGDQEILNPRGVNCIRTFRGRGTRVWGARTTSSDPAWKYVNVRRLFLFVEESIDEGTQWVVFEPNDEQLWARVRQTIRNFLTSVWEDGALMGSTPEEAFFVKCDRSTMTQNDIDNGRLICEIGIAPVKPAEFVVFRIAQTTAGAEG